MLVQAFLDAPVFETRWRWNATISLAVPRSRGGRKLRAAAAAHARRGPARVRVSGRGRLPREHSGRSRDPRSSARRPDGPRLPRRGDGFRGPQRRAAPHPPWRGDARRPRHARTFGLRARDPRTRSPTRSSTTRRSKSGAATPCRPGAARRRSSDDLGALDPAAIDRVRDEERPDPRDADELHDALHDRRLSPRERAGRCGPGVRRCARVGPSCLPVHHRRDRRAEPLVVAAERLPELDAVHPGAAREPRVDAPASRTRRLGPGTSHRRAAARTAVSRRPDERGSDGALARHR